MKEKDNDRQAFRNRFGDRPDPELAFPHELPYWDGAADGWVAGLDYERKQQEESKGERMKPRNFELSPLTEDEFAMMLISVSEQLLKIYMSWIREEMNRRGIDEHPQNQ